MFLLLFCPPKPKWRHTTSVICYSEAGALLMFVAVDFHLVISVDYGFFGQPEDKTHDTLRVLIVRDRKSKSVRSHPVPLTGVTHPYPACLESDQEPGIVGLCDAVKNGWHGEIVPEASSKREQE